MRNKEGFCPYCMNHVVPGEPCKNCGLTSGSYTPSPHHLPPGTVLRDRYLIGRVLGEGGFGITYIGCDLRLELKVAIKEYFPTDQANRVSSASITVTGYSGAAGSRFEEGRERFLNEARTMAKMDKQPVIVSVRDFFEAHNTAYIVMEYVEGVTFKDLVAQRGGRIPAGWLLHTIEPLFSALTAMHGLGLIHRDISPENLMLENGEIRLLDFGCARESRGGDATVTIALKQGYAPVEQYQNKGQGPWTDVYALSATIYYCLTGQKPPQSMDRLMDDELVPPRKLGVELTERQEKALLYGMGVRPKHRFQSVEEFYAELYMGSEPGPLPPGPEPPEPVPPEPEPPGPEPPEPEPPAPFKLSRRQIIGIACGAAAALVLLTLLVWHSRREPDLPMAEGGDPASYASSLPPEDEGGDEPAPAGDQDGDIFADTSRAADEAQLRTLMYDDNVSAVIVRAKDFIDVTEPLEITKPLLLKGGARFYVPVTVDGADLRVEGQVYGHPLLHTRNGGSITLAGDGIIQIGGAIWNDHEDDLRYEDGAKEFDGTRIVADEEELFKDAVHVTSLREFNDACHTGRAIVVDKSFSVNSGIILDPQGPLLISEGVTLTLGRDDLLSNNGHLFINRGKLSGRLHMNDAPDENGLINYGTMDIALHFSGYGSIVNMGRWEARSGQIMPGYHVFNGASGSIAVTEGSESSFLDFAGPLFNFGSVSLGERDQFSYINLAGDSTYNAGSITVGGSGHITVEGQLLNCGSLEAKSGGEVMNFGLIENNGLKARLKFADHSWSGEGPVLFGGRSQLEISDEELQRHQGSCAAFNWTLSNDAEDRFAENEQQLREALADESCLRVRCGTIAVEGDLEINKIVAAERMSVSGNITVTGSQSLLFSTVSLSADSLTVDDGAMATAMDGFSPGSVNLLNGGMLCTYSYGNEQTYGLHAADGGHAVFCGDQQLKNCNFDLEGGELRLNNNASFFGCSFEIGEGSKLVTSDAELLIDSGSSLSNHGEVEILGWAWQRRLLFCRVENHGVMRLHGGVVLGEEGSPGFTNYGSLVLEDNGEGSVELCSGFENLGEISSPNGCGFKLGTNPTNVTGVSENLLG